MSQLQNDSSLETFQLQNVHNTKNHKLNNISMYMTKWTPNLLIIITIHYTKCVSFQLFICFYLQDLSSDVAINSSILPLD